MFHIANGFFPIFLKISQAMTPRPKDHLAFCLVVNELAGQLGNVGWPPSMPIVQPTQI
jgi:hypothetical protein